jgi:myo-inositol-1(or 4)-monophosphatase
MIKACEKAITKIIRDFNEVEKLQISNKGPADFVSNTDIRTEKIIKDYLTKFFPQYGFWGEESGLIDDDSTEGRWIVDPIDGTHNFIHAIPHFAISIALEIAGQIVAGVIYDPIKQEVFTAEKDQGAMLNGKSIKVAQRKKLSQCLVATGIPFKARGDLEHFSKILAAIAPQVSGVRCYGAAALDMAYVACGRFDLYFDNLVQPYDIAAGLLIAEEAGAITSTFNKQGAEQANNLAEMFNSNSILVANKTVRELLLQAVAKS